MSESRQPPYRSDLARIHHEGFGFHADAVAPGVIALLEPVLDRNGLVVEVGCGSGLLTRHLIDAGHRVIATDASPAMLDLARSYVPDAEEVRQVTLPEDSIPRADAVVSVGHALNYLPDVDAIDAAIAQLAAALRPGGLLIFDVCDLEWVAARVEEPPKVWIDDDWVLMTRFSVPSADRFVRDMTTFVANGDGTWRRDDERHVNVMIDTRRLPETLVGFGVDAEIRSSFGDEALPSGLHVVVGSKRKS